MSERSVKLIVFGNVH